MTYEQAVLKAQSLTNDLYKKHSLLWLFIELLEIDHSTYYMNLNENLNDDMSHQYFKLVNTKINIHIRRNNFERHCNNRIWSYRMFHS